MKKDVMFISESVTEGHPDKLCDQISDAILDQFLIQDPYSEVHAQCAVSSAIIFIAARFASEAKVDLTHVARKVIKRIGFDQPDFNASICSILTAPKSEPLNPKKRFEAAKLSEREVEKIRVGNPVTVFGFACDHTSALMPMPIYLAHKLARQMTEVRREKVIPYLGPEGKVQVGVVFKERRPYWVHNITIMASQQEIGRPSAKTLEADIQKHVIDPVLAAESIAPDWRTNTFINPEGPHQGGPAHHSGLTGRKNAIDTYGEYCRHSGKALSGKDPLRIDRIGAYIARYAAKNVVAAGLASECEVMLSYSLGFSGPVSMQVQTFGTGKEPDAKIADRVRDNFDFRIAGILKQFDLRHLPAKTGGGFYQKLAAYGHFGRNDIVLPWEKTDKIDQLAS